MQNRVQNATGSNRTVRLLALGGVAGPLLFVPIVVAGGLLYDGYSHAGQAISELGGEGAEYAALQNFNFIMIGVLVLGFSWALARVLGGPPLGPGLVGFFGLSGAIANGLLPCDLGCDGQTTVGLLHNISGVGGFVAAIASMLVLARRWRGDPRWRSHASFTCAAAFVAFVGLAGFMATRAAGAESIDGLVERIFAAALLTWIAVTAARLYGEASHGDRVAGASRSHP